MDPSEMWGTGDYKAVADRIASAGETVVERAGIEPGMDVLDVACGTGNATVPAAKLAARVTGLDPPSPLGPPRTTPASTT